MDILGKLQKLCDFYHSIPVRDVSLLRVDALGWANCFKIKIFENFDRFLCAVPNQVSVLQVVSTFGGF